MKKLVISTLIVSIGIFLSSCGQKNEPMEEVTVALPVATKSFNANAYKGHPVYFKQVVQEYGDGSPEQALATLLTYDKIVIDFFAEWCGPCRAMGATIEKIASTYPDVIFIKVNTDEFGDLSNKYGIKGIPTLLYFKSGKQVARTTGALSESKLREHLKKAFGI